MLSRCLLTFLNFCAPPLPPSRTSTQLSVEQTIVPVVGSVAHVVTLTPVFGLPTRRAYTPYSWNVGSSTEHGKSSPCTLHGFAGNWKLAVPVAHAFPESTWNGPS